MKRQKLLIQSLLLLVLVAISVSLFSQIIEAMDSLFHWEFQQFMLIFAFFLGLIYHTIGIVSHYMMKKPQQHPLFHYFCQILQPSYLLTCFIWYFFLYVSKFFSDSQQDSQQMQTIIIAFALFFLTVRMGKEISSLVDFYRQEK